MELPTVMQNIGLALLTVFIPLGLYLYESREKNFNLLDSAVILDYLIDGKRLIFKLILLFGPLLFWDINISELRIVIVLSWLIGVLLVLQVLASVYEWVRGDKYKYRFLYLKTLQDGGELEDLWKSIWEVDSINFNNKNEFLKIFTNLVDNLLSKDQPAKVNIVTKLLTDFQIFIKKNDLVMFTLEGSIFDKLLEWDILGWRREYSYLVNKDNDTNAAKFMDYSMLRAALSSLIKIFTERALIENHPYGFFERFKKHIEENQGVEQIGLEHTYSYVESILPPFFTTLFEKIVDSPHRYDIWDHFFPRAWKITLSNIESGRNEKIISIVFRVYSEWTHHRFLEKVEDGYDRFLDNVTSNLFPETDPHTWALIITFLLRSWGENRMKSLIEKDIPFGFGGRIMSFSINGNDREDASQKMQKLRNEQIENSLNLALQLLRSNMQKEILEANIKVLKDLSYLSNQKFENKRKEILDIFSKILERWDSDKQ